jgi:hypothetical protein
MIEIISDFMQYLQIKRSFLLGLYALTGFYCHAQSGTAFTKTLFQTFQQKDTAFIAGELAPNFSIAGHTDAGARFRLNQIVKNYPVSKIESKTDKKTKKGSLINLDLISAENKTVHAQALLDSSGKLIHLSLFDELYGVKRMEKTKLRAINPF